MTNFIFSSLALAAFCATASSQSTVFEIQKIGDSSPAYFDKFGTAVAVEGNLAVATAPFDISSGKLVVFERSGSPASWSYQAEVTPLSTPAAYHFGQSVLLDTGTIWVSAPYSSDTAVGLQGAIFSYENQGGTWTESIHLTGDSPGEQDGFGWSFDKDGNTLAVGAPGLNNYTGAVYVFEDTGNGWVKQAKFFRPGGQPSDFFGDAVSLDGSVLAVGSPQARAVVVYRKTAGVWSFEQEIPSPEPNLSANFGNSVAIEGDLLVIGDSFATPTLKGAAYAYRWNGGQWALEQKLVPSVAQSLAYFGTSLDIDAGRIAVGSPGLGFESATGRGAVYQYHHSGTSWVEVQRWSSTDLSSYFNAPGTGGLDMVPRLGESVDLQGSTLMAGAPYTAYGHLKGTGAAYMFDAPDLALDITPDSPVGGQNLRLHSQGGLPGTPSLMYLVSVGGAPVLEWVAAASGLFAANGGFNVNLPVSPSLTGLTIELASIGFWNPTTLGVSNVLEVTFQ